jgi:hypothetical protein
VSQIKNCTNEGDAKSKVVDWSAMLASVAQLVESLSRSRQDLPDRHHRHRSSYRAGKPENFDAKVPEIRGGPAW